MEDVPYNHQQPASHFEYVVNTKEAPVIKGAEAIRVKEQALALMGQMMGWCSEAKGAVLVDLILKNRPSVVVEIGVWGGKSVVPMAYALKVNGKGKIYGIDPWSSYESIQGIMNEDNKHFWQWADHKIVMDGLIEKIDQFDLNDQVELIRDTSEGAAPIYEIDILHVDGNHSDEPSYLDVTKWVPLVKSGGMIIFDDMTWYENNVFTTSRAVKWLDEHCIKFAEFSDTCVWGIWIKP